MGKSKAPPPPDYAALATAQGAANVQAAQQTAALNRPDQYDQNGSQTWALKPGADAKNPQAGDWVVTTKLNDTQQALQDQQNQLSSQYGNLAAGALNTVGNTMSTKFDTSGLPQAGALSTNGLAQYQGPAQLPKNMWGAQQSVNGQYMNGTVAGQMMDAPRQGQMINGPSQGQRIGGPVQGQMVGGPVQGQMVSMPTEQRQDVSNQGFTNYGQVGQSTEASRQAVTNALYQRQTADLNPQTQQQTSDMRSRLAVQGITAGSEAYNREMDNMSRQQASAYENARNSAVAGGGAEESRINGMNLGNAQFSNSTRAQQLNEQLGLAGFNNGNIDARFGQQVTAANANNAQMNAQFNQGLAGAQANNSQLNSQFGQGMAGTQANNAQGLSEYDRMMASIQANNGQMNTQYAQGLAGMQANNAQRNNQYGQELSNMQANNSQLNSQWGQQMTGRGFENDAQNTAFSQAMQQAQFQNGMQGQQFGQAQAMNQANNTLHNNAIQEALMQRELGMNEANALRTGNQVGGMQFQAYGGGGQIGAAPVYQAGSDGYNAALAANNANNAGSSGLLGGAMSIGKLALNAYTGGAFGAATAAMGK